MSATKSRSAWAVAVPVCLLLLGASGLLAGLILDADLFDWTPLAVACALCAAACLGLVVLTARRPTRKCLIVLAILSAWGVGFGGVATFGTICAHAERQKVVDNMTASHSNHPVDRVLFFLEAEGEREQVRIARDAIIVAGSMLLCGLISAVGLLVAVRRARSAVQDQNAVRDSSLSNSASVAAAEAFAAC